MTALVKRLKGGTGGKFIRNITYGKTVIFDRLDLMVQYRPEMP